MRKSRNPIVFFDISLDSEQIGRLEFELFSQELPKTCENFRMICTGEKFSSQNPSLRLHYKGCLFHRIIPGFICQGGEITPSGGESIYPKRFFEDEGFKYKNNYGYLAMANCGKNTNGSQFFINLGDSKQLNESNVVFGKLVKGDHILKIIEKVGTHSGIPSKKVSIEACGQYML